MPSHLWVIASRFMEALGGRPPVVFTLGDELEGRATLAQASQQAFGTPAIPLFDIANADVVFSFGANFLETWLSPVHYSRAYGQMRRGPLGKRGFMVQFEPRLSSTAGSADEWVLVRPGTEGLVALALGKIILDEGLTSSQDSAGFESISVADVAQASLVPAERLENLARLFAGAPRPVAVVGGASISHGDGVGVATAIHALNRLVRQLGEPGGAFLAPEIMSPELSPPPASSFRDLQSLIEDMAAEQVEVLLVHGANPGFEVPRSSGFTGALSNVDFVVSFCPTVDETAMCSDLILPDHTSLEGWGYHVTLVADRPVIGGQQPVMRPLYDTRATADVLLAMARDLGGNLARALPWRNEVEFLRETVGAWRGEASDEAFWSDYRRRGGLWSSEQDLRSPVPSATVRAFGGLAAPREDTDYPLHLHLYPSVTLFDGRGANKSWLQETPDPMTTVSWQTWVEIHPHTAEQLGVKDNDVVLVISPADQIEAIVYVYHGIDEDTVAMPLGQGHEHHGRFASGHGSNPARLLVPKVDRHSGALAWASTKVMIVRTGRTLPLARLESAEGVEHLRGGGH